MRLVGLLLLTCWRDRSTAGLGGSSRVQCTLQASSPAAKHDWLLELQNVKLALGW